jgi:histidine phosphotransferase ChpT
LDGSSDHAVDAHAVQPYYTGLLAKSCGLAISLASEDGSIVVSART